MVRVAPNGRSGEAYMQLLSSDGATVVGARSEVADAIALRAPGAGNGNARAIRLPSGRQA